jgi:hypothetical protein
MRRDEERKYLASRRKRKDRVWKTKRMKQSVLIWSGSNAQNVFKNYVAFARIVLYSKLMNARTMEGESLVSNHTSEGKSVKINFPPKLIAFIWFNDLTAVVMKSSIFWDITPCSPLKINRLFEGTHRLHLQGRISWVRYQREGSLLATCFHAGVFLGLSQPEDGGNMFIRNVGWLPTGYTAFKPPAFTLLCSAYSSLKMEAIYSSETSVDFQWTTRRYVPEDTTILSVFSSTWGAAPNVALMHRLWAAQSSDALTHGEGKWGLETSHSGDRTSGRERIFRYLDYTASD